MNMHNILWVGWPIFFLLSAAIFVTARAIYVIDKYERRLESCIKETATSDEHRLFLEGALEGGASPLKAVEAWEKRNDLP